MNDLIVWRDKLQELYAMKSIYIDKAVQFVLALVTFLMINQNIGLMKAVATPGCSGGTGSNLHLSSTGCNGVCGGRTCNCASVQTVYRSGSGSGTDLCGNVYLLLQIYSEKGTSSAGHTGSIYASCSVCGAGCLCACTWTDFSSTDCIWNDHLLYDRMCENFGNSNHQCRWNYQADFAVCEDGIPG